jgi:thymidine phosphorylase
MLRAQGAVLDAYQQKLGRDTIAPVVTEVKADRSGTIQRCDARIVGEVVRDLGGGRLTKDTIIQPDVGVDQLVRPGRMVKTGDILARVHAMSEAEAAKASQRLRGAFQIEA